MKNVFEYLDKLNLPYSTHEHAAVFTTAEAAEHYIDADFGENKNLFLRNRKGTRHFLVTVAADKKIDLKKLAEHVGEKALGFASEKRLQKYLGLKPGSVSPFGLINDTDNHVLFFLDEDLLQNEHLGFHPNINTQTVIIPTEDFQKYLTSLENKSSIISLDTYTD